MKYYLGLYPIRDIPLIPNISIPFKANSSLISRRYNYGHT